jgi:response regulator RpfG family c-di-GMP phosphodiesterase
MTATLTDVRIPPVTSRPRILFVDDEPLVLQALSRMLRHAFEIVTEPSGPAGLSAIRNGRPFAVIVSDMRMPDMNGATFLKMARAISHDSVRVLLTGQADVTAAIASVNEGQIFRFLEKPCPLPILEGALNAAVEQYRLITAERVLLEQTLNGSIELLTDVLALASPVAFSKAGRLKRTMSELAAALGIEDRWEIEIAALLSQLGSITLPPQTVEKINRGEEVDARERDLVAAVPRVARQLIGHIPRLEGVRAILEHYSTNYDGRDAIPGEPCGDDLPIGSRLLKVVLDLDTLEAHGQPIAEIVETLRGRVGAYDPRVLAALCAMRSVARQTEELLELPLTDVRVGMIFAFDVVAENGLVLIGRGQSATPSLVRRIQNHWRDIALREPARVVVPGDE